MSRRPADAVPWCRWDGPVAQGVGEWCKEEDGNSYALHQITVRAWVTDITSDSFIYCYSLRVSYKRHNNLRGSDIYRLLCPSVRPCIRLLYICMYNELA